MKVEEPPAGIELTGCVTISNTLAGVMIALTPVSVTAPVLLILTDCNACVTYPSVTIGNIMFDGLIVHVGRGGGLTVNDNVMVLDIGLPFAVVTVNTPL